MAAAAATTAFAAMTLAGGAPASTGASTRWSEAEARADLISRLAATPLAFRDSLHDSAGNTMDTAKILQASPGNYLAVYTTGNVIKLATSTDLMNWTYVRDLDTSATQPYIAAGPDGSYLLADEKFDAAGATSGSSHLYFAHYASLGALLAGQPDWHAAPPLDPSLHGDRFYSQCNEGTPDIHGIRLARGQAEVSFGFHYNSRCGSPGPDREAYGSFTVTGIDPGTGQATASWSATRDIVRDKAAAAIGYTGSQGGRDDITWHGWRFSIGEAQCGSRITADCTVGDDAYDFASLRYILYDYSNRRAYPVAIPPGVETARGSVARCHGNPKITALNAPGGRPVLVVTGYIFGPPGGCVPAGTIAGEFLYEVPAS